MRENRGGGRSSKNSGDPTLKDHEREKGVSGEAIQGEKKAAGSDKQRTESRTDANVN